MAETTSISQSCKSVEISAVRVKEEKIDVFESQKTSEVSNPVVAVPQLLPERASNVTIPVVQNTSTTITSSSCQSDTQKKVPEQRSNDITTVPAKTEPPPIDIASIRGKSGWTTVGEVHLPLLIRGEDRYVAVRMVESKLISRYVDIFPWCMYASANIRSYFVTDNEAKLLNEINSFHCDNYYGAEAFTVKDIVVRLSDTVKFYEFLETCRTKLCPHKGNLEFQEQCGFVLMNYKAIPYVRKEKTKYVLYNMVYQEGVSAPISCTEIASDWDISYFRFLSYVINSDQRSLKEGATLCSLDDLKTILGVTHLEEWWPNVQYSSKSGKLMLNSTECMPKYGDPLPFVQPEFAEKDSNLGKLRDIKELQVKSMLTPFPDMDWLSGKSAQQHEVANDSRAHLFPTSLESLLATSQPTLDYQLQYANHMQSSVMPNISQHLGTENGLSSLSSSRPRPYPPPPPLVRLEQNPQSTSVPIIDHRTFGKVSSLYPYMQASVGANGCPPWISGMLEPEWLQKNDRRATIAHQASELANAPQSQSRLLNGEDQWTVAASSVNSSGTGSSSYARSYGLNKARESYDQAYSAFCRDERVAPFHRGSPRPATGAGPPPHYPTPPQSSPLQSLSILDCPAIPGLTDLYNMRATPLDLCSPPPSPEIRSSLSMSPRGNYGVSTSYQPHTIRLAQVDTRYLLAINVEPHKHNSVLVVPISEVVNKFLRGASVEQCQVTLETFFGIHLYECTSLQQEAYAKHNVPVLLGSKLVSVVDLRNYLCQLQFLSKQEKQCERNYEIRGLADDQFYAKRFRGKE